jgi:hypothetical protein
MHCFTTPNSRDIRAGFYFGWLDILEILAQAPEADHLEDALPKTQAYVRRQVDMLRAGRVQVERLLVSQMLSREVSEKSSPSLASGRLPAV